MNYRAAPAVPNSADSLASIMTALAGAKEGGGGVGGDGSMMDLLGKMSEAYMTAKKENNELKIKVQTVEAENADLKKKVAKLFKKLDKMKQQEDSAAEAAAGMVTIKF